MTEARLHETRAYAPPSGFAAQANVTADIYAEADADPIAFWERAAQRLDWFEPWHTAHEWEPPTDGAIPAARWFVGGKLNVAYNCVDRHVVAGRGDKVAVAIGPVAKPKHIVIVPDLPKTRSGKIMRRLLAQLWEAEQDRRAGREPKALGDTTSLQNPWAVDDIADVLSTAELRTS